MEADTPIIVHREGSEAAVMPSADPLADLFKDIEDMPHLMLRRRIRPVLEVEEQYGLPRGYLKGESVKERDCIVIREPVSAELKEAILMARLGFGELVEVDVSEITQLFGIAIHAEG